MLKLFVASIASLLLCSVASAQMVTGDRMTAFGQTFDVKLNQRSYAFNAQLADTSIPANILWPGDQPTWTIQLQNLTAQAIEGDGKIDVSHYGTRGEPGDIWAPTTFKISDVASIPIQLNIPAHGFQNVTISPQIPETFGGYGVVADLGEAGRRFVFSCARTFKPMPQRVQYPVMSLDDAGGDTLQRLGIEAIRHGISWVKPDAADYDKRMAQLDAEMQDDLKKNITVMLMVMGGEAEQPLNRPRPHLNDQDVMLETKSDTVWMPGDDEAFQQWVTTVTSKYGWPRGPVTSMSLWNEPWEGISISGWGADMTRYREIFHHMADGIGQSRKDANVQVLVAGCDSSGNTIDKLFPDDTDEFLPLLDVCTIHYQGLSSPSTYRKWLNRKSPNGRIKIWDTESWVANVDDRVGASIAACKAAGYDRTMGVFGGNVWDNKDVQLMTAGGKKTKYASSAAWSTAASVGAAVHFLGDRPFNTFLFQNGLPWVMVFDGLPKSDSAGKALPNAEDGTIVVVGDLADEFGKDGLLYRGIMGLKQADGLKAAKKKLDELPATASADDRAAARKLVTSLSIIQGGTMAFDDGGGKFQLFDFYGNPVKSQDHKITVPLDGRGFFLRGDGSPGAFAALTKAVAAARVDGFECLQLAPHDLLATIDTHPSLTITCTNVLNRSVTGKLTGTFGKLQLQMPDALTFAANETRDVQIPVTGGEATADNTYPLSLKFDAGADGFGEHDENMHVNVIAHRTITIDGKLDDWKGVLPQPVTSEGSAAPTMQEAAWFPFQKFDTSIKSGVATGYLAYDENNFYFAAKAANADPDPGTIRFETRKDDEYYYPAVSYEMDPTTTFATKPGMIKKENRKPFALQKPGATNGERNYDTIESLVKAIKLKIMLPKGTSQQVAFYFLDDDDYEQGRRDMELLAVDANTHKQIDKRRIKDFGGGTYAIYNLSSDTEFTFTNASFLDASLAGVFFDDGAASAAGASHFVKFDEQTSGNWQGVFGKLGYMIPGSPEKYPSGVSTDIAQTINKKDHVWPDGVRRYSYRKQPLLPSGNAPNFDNVQIAFNAIPLADDTVMAPNPPGAPPMFISYRDTDYEYALNKVADEFGGGTEIWRLLVPNEMRVNFYPRQPKAAWEGAVKNGKLAVTQDGGTRITEVAIPWSELPDVKKLLDAGKPVKFDFRVNDHKGTAGMELAWNRGVSRVNNDSFGCNWIKHWANEVEFAFDKSATASAK